MLGSLQGKHQKFYVPDYVVFDLETTGVSRVNDAVVEIAAIKVKDGKPVSKFQTLVDPERHIPESVTCIHHITDEMVAGAPKFPYVLERFFLYIQELPLVGHNIMSFDMKFIYRDSYRYFGMVPDNPYTDTLFMARKLFKEMEHHRLVDMAERFEIPTAGAHRALYDCYMNHLVYEKMQEKMSCE